STDVSSWGCLFRGKPSSTRKGPKGDIHLTPAPTDFRKSPKLKSLNELPTSKKATPRTPYCSMMGNNISVLNTAALSPPMTSVPLQTAGVPGGEPSGTEQFDGARGARLRSAKPRTELIPPKKYLSNSGKSLPPSFLSARPTP